MSKIICKIEEYFDNKVKRILPLIYDKTDLLRFKTQGILSNIEPRIKDYYINIRLRLVGYSQLYEENSNLNEADTNMSDRLDCYEKYYQYKITKDEYMEKLINESYDYVYIMSVDNEFLSQYDELLDNKALEALDKIVGEDQTNYKWAGILLKLDEKDLKLTVANK